MVGSRGNHEGHGVRDPARYPSRVGCAHRAGEPRQDVRWAGVSRLWADLNERQWFGSRLGRGPAHPADCLVCVWPSVPSVARILVGSLTRVVLDLR
jgi:hypothetical protein